MQYSLIKSCLLALATASTVVAQIPGFDVFTQPTTPGSSIAAGSTYTIKWTPSSPAGQISIILLEGSSNTSLQLGATIAKSIESVAGSYDWQVPTSLPAFPFFGFKLQLDSDPMTFQYSTYFTITGLSASGSSSSGAASTATSASTTVTVQISQIGPITSGSTTISSTLVTLSNTTSATSTPAGIFPNSTVTTTTSKATGTASSTSTSTSSSASASGSPGAASSIVIGGTGLLSALLVSLSMLL